MKTKVILLIKVFQLRKHITKLTEETLVYANGEWNQYRFDGNFGGTVTNLESFLLRNKLDMFFLPKDIRHFFYLGFKNCLPSHGRHQIDYYEEIFRKFPRVSKVLSK